MTILLKCDISVNILVVPDPRRIMIFASPLRYIVQGLQKLLFFSGQGPPECLPRYHISIKLSGNIYTQTCPHYIFVNNLEEIDRRCEHINKKKIGLRDAILKS